MNTNRKEIYHISISNYTFNKIVNIAAGILKQWSYKYIIRKRAGFKILKRDRRYHKEIRDYYKKYGIKNIDYYWHDFYKYYSKVDSTKYIPDYIYYRYIEPKFNKIEFAGAYSDKNTYHRFEDIIRVPKALVYNMHGLFYDGNHNEISKEEACNILDNINHDYLIKPSIETGSGRNIASIGKSEKGIRLNEEEIKSEEIFRRYKENYSVQEILKQSKTLFRVNPSAMNTARIYTVRIGDEIVYMNSFMRFGINGKIIDNVGAGGIYCGINPDGSLTTIGYDIFTNPVEEHPETKIKFSDIKLPDFDKMQEKAIQMHRRLSYFRFASWDISFDENDEVCLVEVNLAHQDIKGFQILGGPVFGEYTDQILEETFLSK